MLADVEWYCTGAHHHSYFPLLIRRYPLLLVGPTGTGKSVYTQRCLLALDALEYQPPNIIGFSARTTANMAQYLIDAKLDRRRKGVFAPPMGKKAVIFVDDLNMPQLETYGAQPPIELLRQYMDHGGWYDRQNLFRQMDDVLFVAAMGPPGERRRAAAAALALPRCSLVCSFVGV